MVLVLAAGLAGYLIGELPGLALGVGVFGTLSYAGQRVTPPGGRVTLRESEMRRKRRQRERYEATQRRRVGQTSGFGFGR